MTVEELLRIEAEERSKLHANHASRRPLSDDYDLLGLAGEAEFQRTFHVPLDLNRRPSGDGRVDFIVPLRFTLNVKTARKPFYLIEEQGKVACDLYVLAQYFDDTRKAELLGWEWGQVLARAPVRDFGHGIINHFIPRDQLKSMAELRKRIMRLV